MTDHRRPRLTAHSNGDPECNHRPKKDAVRWADMTPLQRVVTGTVIACGLALVVAGTVAICVTLTRAVF